MDDATPNPKKRARGARRGGAPSSTALVEVQKRDTDDLFLDTLQHFEAYMFKINPKSEHIGAYRRLALFGCLREKIFLDGKDDRERKVDKFGVLRKVVKTRMYRDAKLMPRPTDTDFPDGSLDPSDAAPAAPTMTLASLSVSAAEATLIDFKGQH